jgi:tetratricopeptide (TPR) repeat protein
LGNYDLARALCRQAAQAGKESHLWLGNCAKALAEAGNTSQARLLAAKLSRLRPEDTLIQQVHLPIVRSIIERQRGNPQEAVELLVPVARFEQGELQILYYRAQAYAAAGQYDKAIAEYQRLLDQRGWTAWCVFAPLAQHGLAKTYALQHQQARGRKAYEDFFSTWRDATPAIPRLRQAKIEYKMLLDSTQPEQPQIAAMQSLGY